MDLPAKYGNKKIVPPKNFFAKSLKSAKWTCQQNMVSLAQWEQVSYNSYSYYSYSSSYTLKIRANEHTRLRNNKLYINSLARQNQREKEDWEKPGSTAFCKNCF